jgi:tetratricopeptide (TPR) repeat protein
MSKKLKPAQRNNRKVAKPAAAAKSIKTKAKTKSAALKQKPVARLKSAPAIGKPSPKAPLRPVRAPSGQFAGAVAALEVAIKLMYAEDYGKAVKAFNAVIADYPEEPEIQASAKARVQACEKKLQERGRAVFKTADDHYNVAVAMMNRGDLQNATTHLEAALKLAPKADHILYAMAATNALLGNRDQALSYLKQSIHHRAENRFQALQDNDFAVLAEEQAFKDLVAPPEK